MGRIRNDQRTFLEAGVDTKPSRGLRGNNLVVQEVWCLAVGTPIHRVEETLIGQPLLHEATNCPLVNS